MRYFLLGVAFAMAVGAGYAVGAYHPQPFTTRVVATSPAIATSKSTDRELQDAAAVQAKIEQMRQELCDSQQLLDLQMRKMREGFTPGVIMAEVEILKANQRARREMEHTHGVEWVEKHFAPRVGCQ